MPFAASGCFTNHLLLALPSTSTIGYSCLAVAARKLDIPDNAGRRCQESGGCTPRQLVLVMARAVNSV